MKTIILILLMVFAMDTYGQVSTTVKSKRKTYPHFSISPSGGAIFPLPKILNNTFKPGAMFGLDIAYRINQEVAIYGNGSYAFMNSKVTSAPVGSYLIGIIGPRYYFTKRNLQSAFFLEGGVGIYNFRQSSFDQNVGDTSIAVAQINESKAGLSGGLGGSLSLSRNVDILVKGDYHAVFGDNGISSFVSVMGGLEIRFLK